MINKFISIGVLLLSGVVHASPILVNGGFETGNFDGWSVGITPDYASGGRPYHVDPYGDGWVISSTAQTAYSIPTISNFTAYNGFDGGVLLKNGLPGYEADMTFWLSQSFSISQYNDLATLSFDFRTAGSQSKSFSSRGTPVEARTFTVSLFDSLNTNLGRVYSYTMPYDNPSIRPLVNVKIDLTALLNGVRAPDKLTLRFEQLIPQYYTGGAGFAIDNVNLDVAFNGRTIGANQVPEPTALALFALGMAGLACARRRKQAS